MNNPVYELNTVEGGSAPAHARRPVAANTQITLSVESSPLYAPSVDGINHFVENQSLLGVLHMPSRSKSLEPEVEENAGKTIQHSHSEMGIHAHDENRKRGSAIVQDTPPPGNVITLDTPSRAQDAPLGNGRVPIDVYGSYRESVSFPGTAYSNGGGVSGENEVTFDDPDYDDVQYD